MYIKAFIFWIAPKLSIIALMSFFLMGLDPTAAAQMVEKRVILKVDEGFLRVRQKAPVLSSDQYYETSQRLGAFKRLFPYAGKYEARHRKFGLHQWYYLDSANLSIEEQKELRADLLVLKGVTEVHLEDKFQEQQSTVPVDSLFQKQWSLSNMGQTRGLQGADIELINALKLEKGSKQVIVSIHDSGYDSLHQDIVKNLWVNQGEVPGNGIDDDDNGYIDDVHGFNFARRNNDLQDRNGHGTAVAGIIGAKTNNLGITGIAGGDSPTNGVQLMICRLDNDFENLAVINPQESIVYAADNGSIISQNSWNTFGRSHTVLVAMNYYAEVSSSELLEEGLIVFSAGNNSSRQERYETEVPNVVMVGSTDHKDVISRFSNYGSWLSLCAPGQDIFANQTGGGYDFFSGTSFAAPHVSGVAALILSRFGHEQYTLDSLKQRLLSGTDSIDHLNSINFKNRLGSGRLNAFKALTIPESEPPEVVNRLFVEENEAFLSRIGFVSPSDNTIAPFKYTLETTRLSDNIVTLRELDVLYPNPGDTLRYTLENLDPEEEYSLRIRSEDYFGNQSQWSETISITTVGSPKLEFSSLEEVYFINRDDDGFNINFDISNTGEGPLNWGIEERKDTFLKGFHFKFTTHGIHNDLEDIIHENGGLTSKLETEFTDLDSVQFLWADDNIQNYDSIQVELIREWIIRGGHAVLGIDGNGIDNTNRLLSPLGISVLPYSEIYNSTVSDFPNEHHPIANDLLSLYYYFHRGYLSLASDSKAEVVLRDVNGHPYLVTIPYGKGSLVVCANQFFGDFNLHREDNFLLLNNVVDWIAQDVVITPSLGMGILHKSESEHISISFNHNMPSFYQDTMRLVTNIARDTTFEVPYQLNFLTEDGSNHTPVISFSEPLVVNENTSTGVALGQFFVSDADGDSVALYLESKEPVSLDENYFITVTDSMRFDFETNPKVPFSVLIYDGIDTLRQHFEIELINVNEPLMAIDTTLVLNENPVKDLHIGRWLIEDPEDTVFDFRITDSDISEEAIRIDSVGNIFVVEPSIFNHETNPMTNFTVNVSDGEFEQQASVTLLVENVNEAPLVMDTTLSIDENLGIGTEIGNWEVFDPENDDLQFIISNASVDTDAVNINKGGAITIVRPDLFDYELNTSLTFEVGIFDGELTSNAILTVLLIDTNESPLIKDTVLTTFENPVQGAIIGQWQVSDPENDALKFDVRSSSLDANAIQIDNSGNIIINRPELFDFETGPAFTFEVSLSDGMLENTAELTIKLADLNEIPVVRDTILTINENPGLGEIIGRLLYTDPEEGLLTFEITGASVAREAIRITGSGEIVVGMPAAFDHERNPYAEFEVTVFDGELQTQAKLEFNILDVNEVPQLRDTLMIIKENPELGAMIGHWLVEDPEENELRFSISNGTVTPDAIQIDGQGNITIGQVEWFDHEVNSNLEWRVTVNDGELETHATLELNILDVNEEPQLRDTLMIIKENPELGAIIGQWLVEDPEENELRFSISNGTVTPDAIQIDGQGNITIGQVEWFDHEVNSNLEWRVTVNDGELETHATLEINILDVNEEPQLRDTLMIIKENPELGAIIGQWFVQDPEGNELQFSISNGTVTSEAIQIDKQGNVSIGQVRWFDYEVNSSLDWRVTVNDGELETSAILRINLLNELELLEESRIYPNPVQDFIFLDLPISRSAYQLSLYDMEGRRQWSGNTRERTFRLSIGHLKQGVYLLKIKSNLGVIEKRILKN